MKIATLFGTRPEIIRLSLVIERLDLLCEQIVVHTGQNSDPCLSEVFFEELEIKNILRRLMITGETFENRVADIFNKVGDLFRKERPDRVLILGDTDSGLAAIVAKRMGIPVYHMEAGNRCYDNRVPEEVNRRVIDHASDILMPYTQRSKENLLREGIPPNRIYVTGNPIYEVICRWGEQIRQSNALFSVQEHPLLSGRYFLATFHRQENVDIPNRLTHIIQGLSLVGDHYSMPVVVSLHPRTKDRINQLILLDEIDLSKWVAFRDPFGFFDFVRLEQNACCILTDSGTVQEEACIFKVPTVTVRDTTERPETLECGSNILSEADPEAILGAVETVFSGTEGDQDGWWKVPPEYENGSVSKAVAKILLGHHHDT
jgi:UDP-N-acetylglucosamine 2-epimerase (non-hydrolysing)